MRLVTTRRTHSVVSGAKVWVLLVPIVDRDVLALLEVDVPDMGTSRAWLRAYARDVLCPRFQQKAIYLKFVRPVEQLIISEEEIHHEG